MFRRMAVPFILVAAILFASFGLTRLRFDTDILSMLPGELPEVKGLKAFHEAFSRNDELILVIEGGEDDAGTLSEAAESLGKTLEQTAVGETRPLETTLEPGTGGHRRVARLRLAQRRSGGRPAL